MNVPSPKGPLYDRAHIAVAETPSGVEISGGVTISVSYGRSSVSRIDVVVVCNSSALATGNVIELWWSVVPSGEVATMLGSESVEAMAGGVDIAIFGVVVVDGFLLRLHRPGNGWSDEKNLRMVAAVAGAWHETCSSRCVLLMKEDM